jgi:succinate dehydrogenase flavin-adding protein (antitoxin of CptAB toxin-antitoxin module)
MNLKYPVVLLIWILLNMLTANVFAQNVTEQSSKELKTTQPKASELYTSELSTSEKQLSFQQSFDSFAQEQDDSFNQFLAQRDQEFLQMLKQQWQEFEQMAPLVRDNKPKPEAVPNVQDIENKALSLNPVTTPKQPQVDKTTAILATKVIPKVVDKKVVKTAQKSISTLKPKQKSKREDVIYVELFGNELALVKLKFANINTYNQQGLTKYWKDSARLNLTQLIYKLNHYKALLQLSDWAFLTVVNKYAEVVTNTANNAKALSWLLLNKAGYKAKVALNETALVILMPSVQKVYGVNYYNLDGERFYLFSNNIKQSSSGNIISYQGDYNTSGLKLDLRFNKTVKTIATIKNRIINFQINEQHQQLSLPYDYQRIKYFSDYPQLDLAYYFKAPIDDITQAGLKQIKQQLVGDNTQKINQLLAIIHQAFPYAIDEQQFGKENYLMIEETLHYQASDCEDRAVLFAWLAKYLLDEKVVALNYPGHVSTGIEREGVIVSADPTYIGAVLGNIMPVYRDIQATVIEF